MDLEELQCLPLTVPLSTPFAASWSEDDCVSVMTPKGVYILGGRKIGRLASAKKKTSLERNTVYSRISGNVGIIGVSRLIFCIILFISQSFMPCKANDITNLVFGNVVDRMPAAFGDFNSDKLTDMFVIQNDSKAVEVFLGSSQEPLLRPSNYSCEYKSLHLTSVVPGDFDGDGNMDILITSLNRSEVPMSTTLVHILWGGMNHINCSKEDEPIMKMKGQPLVLDYNQDMIADLFGMSVDGSRSFWVFNTNRTHPLAIPMITEKGEARLRNPHSHAFLDLNGDFASDLFVTTEKNFEIWHGNDEGKLEFNTTVEFPAGAKSHQVGQSLFMDVELKGKMDHVLPVCIESKCTIYVHSRGSWHDLKMDFQDKDKNTWSFVAGNGQKYTDTITVRGGDFNLDGYPDLLATLMYYKDNPKSFLLENVPCSGCAFGRKFAVQWNAFPPYNRSVMGTFFDFYQNGVLDVIIVHQPSSGANKNHHVMAAFKNDLDYDANFVKVTVLAGECQVGSNDGGCVERGGGWGEHGPKSRYGANLPGPSVSYHTTTQEGEVQCSVAAQLSQSAHFALQLPYCIFGLGRTPNFVDALTVGVSWPEAEGRKRTWTQIIPNSQVVVVPWPRGQPSKWRARLFVTPSRLVLLTAAALVGTCALIAALIGVLYWKERREDRKEKLQEAHRFHFDAM